MASAEILHDETLVVKDQIYKLQTYSKSAVLQNSMQGCIISKHYTDYISVISNSNELKFCMMTLWEQSIKFPHSKFNFKLN